MASEYLYIGDLLEYGKQKAMCSTIYSYYPPEQYYTLVIGFIIMTCIAALFMIISTVFLNKLMAYKQFLADNKLSDKFLLSKNKKQ